MSYSVPDMLQSFGGCFVSFSGRNFESVVESFGVSAGFFGVVVRIWFWLCRLWGWAKKKDAGCSARAAPLLVVSSLDVCGGYHVFFCVFWVWLVMAVVFLLLGACHIASSLPHYVAFVCGYFPAFLYVPLWSSQPSCLLLREQSRHLRLLKTV